MKTSLDMIPAELRFNSQLCTDDETIVNKRIVYALHKLYTENNTYIPLELTKPGREDDKERLEDYASQLQVIFRSQDDEIMRPHIEHEAFYLPTSVAQTISSRAIYPRLRKTTKSAETDIANDELAAALRESVEMYLFENPAIEALIVAHLDQISLEELDIDKPRPTAMIMAGFSFLAIELENARYYEDELSLQAYEF